jgi:soluble lytic murein transglycosylase-like protein
MFGYLLKVVCILLITTTFALGNIRHCESQERLYEQMINEICEQYNVEVNLVKAIIRVESVYDPKAISKNKSCKGMMQLSKSTSRKFGVTNVFCPRENITGGVKYIKHLEGIFGRDYIRILASYNVGEGKVYKKRIPKKGLEYAKTVLTFKSKYDKRNGHV